MATLNGVLFSQSKDHRVLYRSFDALICCYNLLETRNQNLIRTISFLDQIFTMANFSLSWDAYKNNICSGLSALQQNGEFVDMTLAADGHYVKVHKMVMSLVSPYIKDMVTATECQHPVIFLNKISYTTLCAILEYIYTGEVTIDKDDLPDLIQAATELHIKGLEDMKYELRSDGTSQAMRAQINKGHFLSQKNQKTTDEIADQTIENTLNDEQATDTELADDNSEDIGDQKDSTEIKMTDRKFKIEPVLPSKTANDTQIQYSMSSYGTLQLILNRYVYYLKYTSRKGSAGHRLWKCSSYTRSIRCPATVITQGGTVIKRMHAHNHPFDDKAILRKVRNNAVFSTMDEKELDALVNNKGKFKPHAVVQNKNTEDE